MSWRMLPVSYRLLYAIAYLGLISAQNSSCSLLTSCSSCVDDAACGWCTSSSKCLSELSNSCENYESDSCASPDYVIIVFIVILAALVCLCFGTCYWRRFQADEVDGLLAPLMRPVQQTRNYIWRNSLLETGELEWMCVICGFDNKPRAKHCMMCGTAHEFTVNYKSDKSEQKRRVKELKARKLAATMAPEPSVQGPPSGEENSSGVFFTRPSASVRHSLSLAQRQEAFNYRRLNQLSLRQKSARRRKMWQRKYDNSTGAIKWVRAPPSATIRASSVSEFSPNSSFSESVSQSIPFAGEKHANSIVAALNSERELSSYVPPTVSPVHPSKSKRENRYSQDSFGDGTLLSSSPGFTSHFDEEGGLKWERVESGYTARELPANQNPVFPRQLTYNNSSVDGTAEHDPMDDLQAVAVTTFREKQLWFLERIAKYQKPWAEGCIIMELTRDRILQLSHDCLMRVNGADLHKWIRIQFAGEPGIDAGGLEREWFGLITEALFSPDTGMFMTGGGESLGGSYHINPLSAKKNPNHLSYFRFAGRVFGKAIMEQQPIQASLCLPIRKNMLALPITFSDLEFVDNELYTNLVWLQRNSNVEALSLDFTVVYEAFGATESFELKPDGANITVTDENKDEYLLLRLKHRMLDSIKPQLENLLRGLYEVVPPDLLSVFDYQELELLMCGVPEIDLQDWQRHTDYLAEYNRLGPRHKVIRWFWMSVEAMTHEERVRLLQFTTGCSRLPAQGFKALQSNDGQYRKFNIQSITKKESLYPRAHTCFNKLDLPLYDSQTELDAYLSVVINMEITGFTME